ncbi:Aste57867_7880 [Aphanomyces stellatus]|uniref:Aste57867_7880 protein n=1 Tax=Aphanomyces stellatus TaxID=120398 RepID=A0A485KIX1_9STRA|nr:hypothetical protein As57867_007850 [Aphanomyces stellatus]VFT84773.1 Aste57867_7880 [Aphanomyces stellatus]
MECETDSRQEVDEQSKANMPKLVIRTLPKGCNPVPMLERPPSRSGLLLPPTIEDDNPFDDITEEKLRQISGKQDLNKVNYLQLTVDTQKQSVEALGELLPSMTQLRLHQSILHSFRDLGTSLHGLQVLWLMRSGVKDLDGIGALTGLRELYLQFNEIADISPLSMHDELHVIDLQGNCVEDIVQLEQLGRSIQVLSTNYHSGLCPHLASLNLADNPVASIPQYRPIVCSYIPHLEKLDERAVADADKMTITTDMIDQALRFKHPSKLKREESLVDGIKVAESPSKSTFESLLDAAKEKDQHSSELTHGTDVVFAGNVTSALRRRSHEHFYGDHSHDDTTSVVRPATPTNFRPSTPVNRESITDTLDRASEMDLTCRLSSKSRDSILHELKAWKMENSVATMTTPKTPRPQTSAGLFRGIVKEAFVKGPTTPRKQSKGGKPHPVEILVLDEAPDEETPVQRQWNLNLECLSPRIGIHPKPTARQYNVAQDDESSSGSDTEEMSKKSRIGLFNVGDSLNAIEEWTERITNSEHEDGPLAVVPVQERCRTPKSKSRAPTKGLELPASKNVDRGPEIPCRVGPSKGPEMTAAFNAATKGPEMPIKPPRITDVGLSSNHIENSYNMLGDEALVMVLQGKDKRYLSHLKTKDSFRSFFQGISSARLEELLRRAYGDGEKMQRRMQLMEGRMTVA